MEGKVKGKAQDVGTAQEPRCFALCFVCCLCAECGVLLLCPCVVAVLFAEEQVRDLLWAIYVECERGWLYAFCIIDVGCYVFLTSWAHL